MASGLAEGWLEGTTSQRHLAVAREFGTSGGGENVAGVTGRETGYFSCGNGRRFVRFRRGPADVQKVFSFGYYSIFVFI